MMKGLSHHFQPYCLGPKTCLAYGVDCQFQFLLDIVEYVSRVGFLDFMKPEPPNHR